MTSLMTSVAPSFVSSGRPVTWFPSQWSFLPSWFARVVLAVAIAALTVARPATAQGTSELFPEPLSSADVEAILDRIGIEGEARVQSLKSFESCVAQILELRKGGIDDYLKNRPASQSIDDVKARVAARRKLLNRFAAIESQLFDNIRSVAPESLLPDVERERARAERRRAWSTANPFLGRTTHVELADLVRETANSSGEPLPQDIADQVDTLLSTFEQQQTSLYRKLSDVATDELLRMASVRAERNITAPSRAGDAPPDSDAWQRYFKELNEARAIARGPQNELRVKARTLLRETAKHVAGSLPPAISTRFRQRFLNTAYPSASHPRDPVPPLVLEARTLHANSAITGDELATVEALAASHATRRDALNERLMDAIDKESATGSSVGIRIALSEDDLDPEDVKRQALFSERAALDESTTRAIAGASEALASKVPAERGDDHGITHDIDLGDMDMAGGGNVVVFATATAGGDSVDMQGMEGMGGMDGAMVITTGVDLSDAGRTGTPAPIKKDQLDAWRERFGFSDDMVVIANLLLDDYVAKYRELEASELAELKSLPSASPGMMFDAGGTPPPPATKHTIARQFELRRLIIDRMVELDREFIDGLATATGDSLNTKELERLKNTRERAALMSA
ncbi:MAG: hypothetical protein SGJ11_06080, partial [Phycisphaerae bacterium]|nr:hypothetical protein [Phycisphaerae bacterium]